MMPDTASATGIVGKASLASSSSTRIRKSSKGRYKTFIGIGILIIVAAAIVTIIYDATGDGDSTTARAPAQIEQEQKVATAPVQLGTSLQPGSVVAPVGNDWSEGVIVPNHLCIHWWPGARVQYLPAGGSTWLPYDGVSKAEALRFGSATGQPYQVDFEFSRKVHGTCQ